MELKENRELIIALKEAKKKQEITIPRLLEILQSKKQTVSRTTLVRLFADGSEDNDSFNYSSTLKPVADVLLVNDQEMEDSLRHIEIVKLNTELQAKNETIEKLNAQIDSLHAQIKKMQEEETKKLSFMRDQIALKDKRMDTKDELIQRVMDRNDRKDQTISELTEENRRLDESIRQLLEKCKKCLEEK